VQWISARAGTNRFRQVAQGLVMGWTKRLTLGSDTLRERSSEPGVENAWKYVSGMQAHTINRMHAKFVLKPTLSTRVMVFSVLFSALSSRADSVFISRTTTDSTRTLLGMLCGMQCMHWGVEPRHQWMEPGTSQKSSRSPCDFFRTPIPFFRNFYLDPAG
jgi:hypothetical protein